MQSFTSRRRLLFDLAAPPLLAVHGIQELGVTTVYKVAVYCKFNLLPDCWTVTGREMIVNLKVSKTSSKGRSVLSTSNIPQGTLICCEVPFACVSTSDCGEENHPYSLFNGRYSKLPHEINLIKEASRSLKSEFQGQSVILASRIVAACHQHTENINTFNNFCKTENFKNSTLEELDSLNVAISIVLALLKVGYGITADPNVVQEALNRISCNGFTIVDYKQTQLGVGMYAFGSLINHSCRPNCIQSFDSEGRLCIRSACAIPAHTEITIAYIDTCKATWCRRLELSKGYHFQCQCELCTADTSDELMHPSHAQSKLASNALAAVIFMQHMTGSRSTAASNSDIKTFEEFLCDWSIPLGDSWLRLFPLFEQAKQRDLVSTFSSLVNNSYGQQAREAYKSIQGIFKVWKIVHSLDVDTRAALLQRTAHLEAAYHQLMGIVSEDHCSIIRILTQLTAELFEYLMICNYRGGASSYQEMTMQLEKYGNYSNLLIMRSLHWYEMNGFSPSPQQGVEERRQRTTLAGHINTALKIYELSFVVCNFAHTRVMICQPHRLASYVEIAKTISINMYGRSGILELELDNCLRSILR